MNELQEQVEILKGIFPKLNIRLEQPEYMAEDKGILHAAEGDCYISIAGGVLNFGRMNIGNPALYNRLISWLYE